MNHQDPPFSVQVELVEGCNLRCSFCGVNGIRGPERTYKFMTPKTAHNLGKMMRANGWNSRIEFAMHGEPTMHPNASEIISILREYLPKASFLMLSNGGGLLPDPLPKIAALFAAGINTLGLDEYDGISLVPRIMSKLGEDPALMLDTLKADIYPYPEVAAGNPHTRQHHKARRLVHISPIDVSTGGTHATLNNHCGSGAPLNDHGAGKPCAKPFREMSVRWDGGVAVCCNDWRGKLKIGNVNADTLDQIWTGPIMQAARRKLLVGERDFGPCKGCDAVSYRTGLLPDKYGKVALPRPTKKDNELLTAASAQRQMAKTVKREWE